MKKLRVYLEYDTECETLEEAQEELQERFAKCNQTASTEFWEGMELSEEDYCSECGITLNLDEEKEDGTCLQCAGNEEK